MPTNKRESFQFGLMMCFGMVLTMTIYNVSIHDMAGTVPIIFILIQFIIGFLIAFLLDWFLVGPIAKKLAFALPLPKDNKIFIVLAISTCMVIGMVLFMSLYGLGTAYFTTGLGGSSFLTSYFSIALKNFIFALPLQLLIMGPIVRYFFVRFIVKPKVAVSSGM